MARESADDSDSASSVDGVNGRRSVSSPSVRKNGSSRGGKAKRRNSLSEKSESEESDVSDRPVVAPRLFSSLYHSSSEDEGGGNENDSSSDSSSDGGGGESSSSDDESDDENEAKDDSSSSSDSDSDSDSDSNSAPNAQLHADEEVQEKVPTSAAPRSASSSPEPHPQAAESDSSDSDGEENGVGSPPAVSSQRPPLPNGDGVAESNSEVENDAEDNAEAVVEGEKDAEIDGEDEAEGEKDAAVDDEDEAEDAEREEDVDDSDDVEENQELPDVAPSSSVLCWSFQPRALYSHSDKPDPATPTPAAGKRKASQTKTVDSQRPAKRRLVEPAETSHEGTVRSTRKRSARNRSQEDTEGTPTDQPRQKSKPTFTQTPLHFKPSPKPSPKAVQTPQIGRAPRRTTTPKSAATPVSSVKFLTLEEKKSIADAAEKYRQDHGLNSTELNDLVQDRMPVGKPSRAGQPTILTFWDTIMQACPGKKRDSVIKYCRSIFHNFSSGGGSWTEKEDEELAHLVDTGGKQWAKWSSILDRPAVAIRKRYENYIVCGSKMKTGPWSDEECKLLHELVQEALDDAGPTSDDQRPPINFARISEQMGGTRSRQQCLYKWNKIGPL